MLVVFRHAPNSTPSNGGAFTQATNLKSGVTMPPIYAIDSGSDFNRQNGIMPHPFMTNQSIIDASSKLGAPLKQASTMKIGSPASIARTPPRRSQSNAYNDRYKTQRCHSYSETGQCNYKEKCQFAHGDDELRQLPRHPKRKTELCRNFHSTGLCNYGERCDFIHNEPMPPPITPTNHQPQSPWPANQMGPPWTAPASGSFSAPLRRSSSNAATTVAPLAIPVLPDLMRPTGGPYLPQSQPFCSFGSAGSGSSNQSCISCADSPPPSSSSCDQSPVSYSPDILMANGSLELGSFYSPPQQQSPSIAAIQQPQHGELSEKILSRIPGSDAAAARRIFPVYDSMVHREGAWQRDETKSNQRSTPSEFLSNPQQTNDLDYFYVNFCRLQSLGKNHAAATDEMGSDNVFVNDQVDDSIGKLGSLTIGDRRLPTFACLTQGDRRRESRDPGIAGW